MTDMPRKLPLYVVKEKTRHGSIVFYFRKGRGGRIRLRGTPGSREFKASYEAALRGQPLETETPASSKQSLQWLVTRYMQSAKWAQLSVATRKQQDLFYKKAIEKSGNVPFRQISPRDIRGAINERKDTPFLANNFLKAMNGLFTWAVENLEDFPINPCAGIARLKTKSDGFAAWTMADVAVFCARWEIGTRPRLAMELLLHTGLRRSDVVHIGKQHMTGRVFSLRTTKTSAVVTGELSDALLGIIAATQTGDLHFIVNERGKPFTVESFGNWFRDRCRDAGITNKSAHGLRKLSATLAADAGATTHELMAQYGWSNTQQAEVYTRGADRARLGIKTSRLVAEQREAMKTPHHVAGKGKNPKK